MKRRDLILMLGGASGGALTLGSGAFSSTSTKRDVNIDVVPDDRAIVGYKIREDVEGSNSKSGYPEFTITSGESKEETLVRVKNQLQMDATIEIKDVQMTTQHDEDPKFIDLKWDRGDEVFISSGESYDICGSIAGQEPGYEIIELSITVDGVDIGVTTTLFGDTNTRQFVARCESDSVDTD